SITYDPANIPQGADESSLSLFRVTNGAWQEVAGSSVNTTTHTVNSSLTGFSTYAVLAKNKFVGAYQGSYSGSESGTFTVTLDAAGNLSGSGVSASAGPFTGTGTVSPSGVAKLSASGS